MIGSQLDFTEAVVDPDRVVQVLLRDRSHADDCVHWRTDIVAHIR